MADIPPNLSLIPRCKSHILRTAIQSFNQREPPIISASNPALTHNGAQSAMLNTRDRQYPPSKGSNYVLPWFINCNHPPLIGSKKSRPCFRPPYHHNPRSSISFLSSAKSKIPHATPLLKEYWANNWGRTLPCPICNILAYSLTLSVRCPVSKPWNNKVPRLKIHYPHNKYLVSLD